ncbi:MAG: hypothetical protein WBO55_18765 [Rhizobiaceae bacterium]
MTVLSVLELARRLPVLLVQVKPDRRVMPDMAGKGNQADGKMSARENRSFAKSLARIIMMA